MLVVQIFLIRWPVLGCTVGFRLSLSIIVADGKFVQSILLGFEGRSFTGVIACDPSRVFDIVDHMLLLIKLKLYGICNTTLSLICVIMSSMFQLME